MKVHWPHVNCAHPWIERSGYGHYVVFLAKHFTLTVPLSTQVYKWAPANLMLWGNPAMD